jgi:subtilisin family serine protease
MEEVWPARGCCQDGLEMTSRKGCDQPSNVCRYGLDCLLVGAMARDKNRSHSPIVDFRSLPWGSWRRMARRFRPITAKPGPDFVTPGGAFGGDEIRSLLVGGGTGSIGVGTSFAAPHVVGAIALLLERTPHLTPDQVKTALLGKCVAIAGGTAADSGAGLLVI